MKILVFTEGTIIMHRNAVGLSREESIRQVREGKVHDYTSKVPVGGAVEKLQAWKQQGAEISYLTSRTNFNEVEDIRDVLSLYSRVH